MKDLLATIIRLIPAYISHFLALVFRPKRFVARLASRGELSVEKGLTFLGVSFVIGWMLTASHSGPQLFLELSKDAAFTLASVVGFGGAICLAWRVVGGRAALQRVFAIHLYYSGVVEVVMAATFLVIMGLIRSDGNLYQMVNDAATSGRWFSFLQDNQDWLLASRTVRSALLLLLVGVAVGRLGSSPDGEPIER